MKKFLLASLIAMISMGITTGATAQRGYTHTVKSAAISAADTNTMTGVEGGIVAFEYNFTETSGTTAGKVYLEGKLFSSWVKLDSVTLSDVATIQTMRTAITNTQYKDYRFVNTNTSASTGTVLCGYFRRPGAR